VGLFIVELLLDHGHQEQQVKEQLILMILINLIMMVMIKLLKTDYGTHADYMRSDTITESIATSVGVSS